MNTYLVTYDEGDGRLYFRCQADSEVLARCKFYNAYGAAHITSVKLASDVIGDALDHAESFIVGFEDDHLQEGILELLGKLSLAKAMVR